MSAAKKRKIEDECRVFNEDWTAMYCVANVRDKAGCLLCRECVSVFKEYNLKRHHQTKHLDFGHNLTNEERKRKCQEFYGSLSAAAFPHLKNFAAKLLSLFGSTYICEQAFSCLKINKSKNRSMVTDCNLNAVMRITTSKLVPQFKNIIKNCEQLHTSH